MKTINTYYVDYPGLETFVKNNREVLFPDGMHTVLVQVFSGICQGEHLLSISRQIRSLIPNAQVVGTTTSGEIMNGLVSGLKTVLSFSVFYFSNVRACFAEKVHENDYELGQKIANTLSSDKAKVLILFSTGLKLDAGQLLKGINSVNPGLPVAGGNAGDNRTNTRRFVSCNENATDHGVVGAVLEGDRLTVSRHSHLGWQPIGKEMTITRSEGSRVYTIDHKPAYQVYCNYLGNDTASDIFNVVEFPLAVIKNGLDICRAPHIRYEDDSIGFFGNITAGNRVRFSFGHVETIIEKVGQLLQIIKRQPAESIFVYSCASRRGFLQESTEIETMPLQNIAPTSGFFTSGEFFHADNNNYVLNTTMTTLLLSESSVSNEVFRCEQEAAVCSEAVNNNFSAIKDNVANRSMVILRALTYLINTVTAELNEKTAELQTVNGQLNYSSSHDSLTGLHNRCFFELQVEQMKAASIGVIMCDVDGLKFVNDTFGHSAGDAVIKATADILQSLFGLRGVVARIGGDEFSVLLPNTSLSEIEEACFAIRQSVDKYNRGNSVFTLSVSVGFSYHGDYDADIASLLKDADNQMYRQKLHRKQLVQINLVQNLTKTLVDRDIITEERINKLQDLYILFALECGISQDNLADLRLLVRFHDIGKIGISEQVLFPRGPLTTEQRKEKQRHCEIGYRIARSSDELIPIADWILKHHEWWNGEGYPLGLKRGDIPLECRILAIVVAYDAMISDRPHRQAKSSESAIEEIKCCAGIQFDPVLVEKFINIIGKYGFKI